MPMGPQLHDASSSEHVAAFLLALRADSGDGELEWVSDMPRNTHSPDFREVARLKVEDWITGFGLETLNRETETLAGAVCEPKVVAGEEETRRSGG